MHQHVYEPESILHVNLGSEFDAQSQCTTGILVSLLESVFEGSSLSQIKYSCQERRSLGRFGDASSLRVVPDTSLDTDSIQRISFCSKNGQI